MSLIFAKRQDQGDYHQWVLELSMLVAAIMLNAYNI